MEELPTQHVNTPRCRPFLKWPGGKRQLLPELIRRIPNHYHRFFEPFIGGGALFFAISPRDAYISDINPELANVYRVVQTDLEALLASLRRHKNTETYFYSLRNADRSPAYASWTSVEKASRLIYLNKTCYNGLYRMNSSGHFNVPFGFYDKPRILDEQNLRACSALIQHTEIMLAPFEAVEQKVGKGDFVYFDPPYAPRSKTSSFTQYYREEFGKDAQESLKALCDRLTARGVLIMVSNSHTANITRLYGGYKVRIVKALRSINSRGEGRGKINEVIITNY